MLPAVRYIKTLYSVCDSWFGSRNLSFAIGERKHSLLSQPLPRIIAPSLLDCWSSQLINTSTLHLRLMKLQ